MKIIWIFFKFWVVLKTQLLNCACDKYYISIQIDSKPYLTVNCEQPKYFMKREFNFNKWKMIPEKLFLDVRINCVTRIVALDQVDLESPGFVVDKSEIYMLKFCHYIDKSIYFLVFNTFKLTPDERIGFAFRDNLHAPINAENLPALILQKKCSGSFFIELILDEPLLTFRAEVRHLYILMWLIHCNLTWIS